MGKFVKYFLLVATISVVAALACRALFMGSQSEVLTGYAQGGTYIVKLDARGLSKREVRTLHSEIDSLLWAIDRSISGYNPGSLLSRYNAGEDVVPDSIFTTAYVAARHFYRTTGGAVDCAAGAIFDLWGFGFKSGHMPSDEAVSEALATCGMKLLPETLEEAVAMPRRVKLNFNAIAQGLSSDMVAAVLRRAGVENFLINIGGEIASMGHNAEGQMWKIGIDNPRDGNDTPGADLKKIIEIPSEYRGVVTSGDYRKFYVENGVKYAHTIDPRTGRPAHSDILSATIIAPTSLEADALATYAMVVGTVEAEKALSARSDVEFYFITE